MLTTTTNSSDYTSVAEIPSSGATREQIHRLYHRYHTAAQFVPGKRVPKVACRTGIGLGYLADAGSIVVGGDYTINLLHIAQSHYR